MNLQHQRIQEACEQLKLPRLAAEWSAIADHCAAQDDSFADFLERVLNTELDGRGTCQPHLSQLFNN